MRLLLSYCKSHIYELHALLAATITLVAMHFVKKPVKEKIAETVEEKRNREPEEKRNREPEEKRNREPEKKRDWAGYRRRCNLLVLVLALLMAFLVFILLSLLSPLITFSLPTMLLSGVFALAEYAVWDQITYGRR